MFRKLIAFFYKRVASRLISPGQKQFVKNRLKPGQKKSIYRLLKSDDKIKRNRINMIAGRLYNLGFTGRPLSELKELVAGRKDAKLKRYAAFELARWHANRHNPAGAKKALQYLALAGAGEKKTAFRRRYAIMAAECYELLGEKEAGKAVIDAALKRYGPDPALYLAAANFEAALADRIRWINQALGLKGHAPITYDRSAGAPSLDSLRPGPAREKAEQACDLPLVSVIVPAYNAQNTVAGALDSILAQSWPRLEVLVVDDCSGDHTVSVIEGYAQKDPRVKLIKAEANRGPYIARNLALQQAAGEFVTTHDTDDWSHPEKIESQVSHLIKNPTVLGNTSQMARTYPELKFYRGNNPGRLILKFISSFMFRREPVMEAIGYWDSVRIGADNEYIRRLRKVFGSEAVVDLPTGPLTFYRKSKESLTGKQAFGHPGFYMGLRKEYYEAQSYHHDRAASLYYSFPQQERPFPVPEPMWPVREKSGPSGRRHFDVIMVSDFRMVGGSVNSSVEEIKAQKKMGLRTGLVQMCWYNPGPHRTILPQVREVLDGDRVQMLVYGEKLSCDLLITRYPPVLQEKQRFIPSVEPGEVRVIMNQPPMRDYGKDPVRRYNPEQCDQNLKHYFGQTGTWHPNSPLVRQALHQHHEEELKGLNLSQEDWVNIIDVEQWRRPSRPPAGNRVRIGRHSRDYFVKWPDTKEVLLTVYPGEGPYEVHIMGGAETPRKILGYLPSQWRVLDFNAVHPRQFLSGLDVFVYFTHPDWVESFARVTIEAMAVGVPVIVPPSYRQLFGEAAVYADPEQVKERIASLMDDDQYYRGQVEKAQAYVENNFGYTRHAKRLEKILGRPLLVSRK